MTSLKDNAPAATHPEEKGDHHSLTQLTAWEPQQTGNILQMSPSGTSPTFCKTRNTVSCSHKDKDSRPPP